MHVLSEIVSSWWRRFSRGRLCVNVNTCSKDVRLGFLDLGFSWVGGLGDNLVSELLAHLSKNSPLYLRLTAG